MNCINHAHENGVNTCSECGVWLCDRCSTEINGRIFCKSCLSQKVDGKAPKPIERRETVDRSPSFLVLLIFSFILPGMNYMYLGLLKRGFLFLTSFFALIFIMSVTDLGLLSFGIPILYITSAFDSFEKRKKMLKGIYVEDSVEDIMSVVRKYKAVIILLAITFFAYSVSTSFLGYRAGRGIFTFAIVVTGIIFLIKSPKKDIVSKKDGN